MVYFYLDINSSYIILKIVYNYYTLEQCLDTSLFEAVKMLNDQLVAV